jgi:TonB family protein
MSGAFARQCVAAIGLVALAIGSAAGAKPKHKTTPAANPAPPAETVEPLPAMLPAPVPDFTGKDPRWIKAKDSDCRAWLSGPYFANWLPSLVFSWTGACSDRLVSGRGVMTVTVDPVPQGIVYWGKETIAGAFSGGVLNGQAQIVLSEGNRFEGEFQNGRLNGTGSQTWPTGTSMKGSYINDHLNGPGELAYSFGQHYVGDFRNDLKSGHGVAKFLDGSVFDGQFKNRNIDGQGTFCTADGKCLKGLATGPRPDPLHPYVPPPYPPIAVRLNQTGTAIVMFHVQPDGHVRDVRLVQSTGHDELDKAATDAAFTWQMLPGAVGGVPVEMEWDRRVEFLLQ